MAAWNNNPTGQAPQGWRTHRADSDSEVTRMLAQAGFRVRQPPPPAPALPAHHSHRQHQNHHQASRRASSGNSGTNDSSDDGDFLSTDEEDPEEEEENPEDSDDLGMLRPVSVGQPRPHPDAPHGSHETHGTRTTWGGSEGDNQESPWLRPTAASHQQVFSLPPQRRLPPVPLPAQHPQHRAQSDLQPVVSYAHSQGGSIHHQQYPQFAQHMQHIQSPFLQAHQQHRHRPQQQQQPPPKSVSQRSHTALQAPPSFSLNEDDTIGDFVGFSSVGGGGPHHTGGHGLAPDFHPSSHNSHRQHLLYAGSEPSPRHLGAGAASAEIPAERKVDPADDGGGRNISRGGHSEFDQQPNQPQPQPQLQQQQPPQLQPSSSVAVQLQQKNQKQQPQQQQPLQLSHQHPQILPDRILSEPMVISQSPPLTSSPKAVPLHSPSPAGGSAGASGGVHHLPQHPPQQQPPPQPPHQLSSKRVSFQPGDWEPDSEASHCKGCSKRFSFIMRKHHCRNCGQVFCDSCTPYRIPVHRKNYHRPVRVCGRCLDLLGKKQGHQSSANLQLRGQITALEDVSRALMNENQQLLKFAASLEAVDKQQARVIAALRRQQLADQAALEQFQAQLLAQERFWRQLLWEVAHQGRPARDVVAAFPPLQLEAGNAGDAGAKRKDHSVSSGCQPHLQQQLPQQPQHGPHNHNHQHRHQHRHHHLDHEQHQSPQQLVNHNHPQIVTPSSTSVSPFSASLGDQFHHYLFLQQQQQQQQQDQLRHQHYHQPQTLQGEHRPLQQYVHHNHHSHNDQPPQHEHSPQPHPHQNELQQPAIPRSAAAATVPSEPTNNGCTQGGHFVAPTRDPVCSEYATGAEEEFQAQQQQVQQQQHLFQPHSPRALPQPHLSHSPPNSGWLFSSQVASQHQQLQQTRRHEQPQQQSQQQLREQPLAPRVTVHLSAQGCVDGFVDGGFADGFAAEHL